MKNVYVYVPGTLLILFVVRLWFTVEGRAFARDHSKLLMWSGMGLAIFWVGCLAASAVFNDEFCAVILALRLSPLHASFGLGLVLVSGLGLILASLLPRAKLKLT